jgi:hypothetical protein
MTQTINQLSLDKNGIYEASIGHIIKGCGLRDKMKPIDHAKGLI